MAKTKATQAKAETTTAPAPAPAPITAKAAADETTGELVTTATDIVPLNLAAIAADDVTGFEDVSAEHVSVPFLSVVQSNSPIRKADPNAQDGDFFNTNSGELFDGLRVIPCGFRHRYLRWAPRVNGQAGFRGEYMPDDVLSGRLNTRVVNGTMFIDVPEGTPGAKLFDPKGKPLFDTLGDNRAHYVLYEREPDVWLPAVLNLSSTQIKKSKRWLAVMQEQRIKVGAKVVRAPSFAFIYHASTIEESNQHGAWFGVNFGLGQMVPDQALYEQARDFAQTVSSGKFVQADPVDDIGDADDVIDVNPHGEEPPPIDERF